MPDFSNLLDQTVENAMSTSVRQCPDGEYRAKVDDLKMSSITIGKGERKGQEVPQLHVTWEILDESVKASLERSKVTCRQSLWIDLDATGNLDTGPDKNVGLGKLREVFDLNHAGFTMAMLKTTPPATVKVKSRADENDPEKKYAEVVSVVKFGEKTKK